MAGKSLKRAHATGEDGHGGFAARWKRKKRAMKREDGPSAPTMAAKGEEIEEYVERWT